MSIHPCIFYLKKVYTMVKILLRVHTKYPLIDLGLNYTIQIQF